MPDEPEGCARLTGSVVGAEELAEQDSSETAPPKKESVMSVLVGRKAPDFSAPAYHKGEFKNVQLSDYHGKWVILCFYPGDFTFV